MVANTRARPRLADAWIRQYVAPPPPSARVIEAARARADLFKREPWRDPASEHYDPLRALREDGRAA